MATKDAGGSSDEEEIDVDKQYDLQRTIMFGQYSRLANFAKSYGEGLRRRAESDVSGTSSSPAGRAPRSRWAQGGKSVKRYFFALVGVCRRVVLPNIAEWLYLIVLAVLMAVLSYLLDLLIEQFGAAHQKFYKLADNGLVQYLLWVTFSIVFVLFSVGVCQILSVNALGSGIPEMKTILRGLELQDYLQIRTLIAKIIGLATVVGSSLPIGKEGPFVHMSSILAHQMGKFIKKFNKSIYNEGHNYELLAAACALGVSSNFAAPIGGVLFSIEVTSTYFAVRNYWRGFFAAVIGAFLFRLFAYWSQAEETITALFKTSFAIEIPFNVYEVPIFALIGVLCGLLAALFVFFHRKCVLWLRKYRRRIKFLDKSVFIYPTLVTIIITTITFPSGTGQYLAGEVTQRQSIDHFFSNLTWREIKNIELLNEDSAEFAIASYWGSPSYMIFVSLSLFLVTRFLFTALANTLPVPAGVFFPVFIIGAALGRLIGEIMHWILGGEIQGQAIEVGGYAVVGAAAMAGGVTHTISTSVIVFELTGQITHILPVMIAVLIANAIANLLQPSFYDSIILIKSLPFLPDLKLSKSYHLFAKDFMRKKDLFYISHQTTFRELQELLREEPHSSYPLIDHPDTKVLLGSVRRDVLMKQMRNHLKPVRDHKRRILANATGDEQDAMESVDLSMSMEPQQSTTVPVFYRQVRHSIVSTLLNEDRSEQLDGTDIELPVDASQRVSFPLELTNLESELLGSTLNLENIQIDPSPFQLMEKTSLYKAHSLFALLGLSHSFVTSNGKLVGVVTLDDLVNAIRLGNDIKTHPYYMTPTTQEMTPLVANLNGGELDVDDDDDDEEGNEEGRRDQEEDYRD